jgi:hypothetical protein
LILVAAVVTVWVSDPAIAGENSDVRFAMHCVATSQYLYDLKDCPQDCDEIDWDLTRAELSMTGGYGIIFLIAYNVNAVAGIEYALEYPTGVSTTFEPPEYWCGEDNAIGMGDVAGDGHIVAWGRDLCLEAESSDGGVAFASIRVRFLDNQPVVLKWAPSSFSYGFDPHNYTMDCTDRYEEDPVVAHHGAVIGGDGMSILGDPCMSGPISEEASWGEVKQKYRY